MLLTHLGRRIVGTRPGRRSAFPFLGREHWGCTLASMFTALFVLAGRSGALVGRAKLLTRGNKGRERYVNERRLIVRHYTAKKRW
jgi:hypothetical protein